MKKKGLVTVISGALILSSVSYPIGSAYGNTSSINSEGTEEIYDYVENVDTEQQAINFSNGEKLTQEENEKGTYFVVSDDNGVPVYSIQKDGENVVVEDLKNDTVENIEVESENVSFEEAVEEGLVSEISTYNNGFVYANTTKMSAAINSANTSLTIGILVSLMPGGIIAGVISTIASYYVGISAGHAYWYAVKSQRVEGNSAITVRTQNVYYQTHLYSNYVGTVTTQQLYTGGPR